MALFQSLLFLLINAFYLLLTIIAGFFGYFSFKPPLTSDSSSIQLEALKSAIHEHHTIRSDESAEAWGMPRSEAEKQSDFGAGYECRIHVARHISNPPATFSKHSCTTLSKGLNILSHIPLMFAILGTAALQAGFLEYIQSVPRTLEGVLAGIFVVVCMVGSTVLIVLGIVVSFAVCFCEGSLAWGLRLRWTVDPIRKEALRSDECEEAEMGDKGQGIPEERLRWWVEGMLTVDEENEEQAEKRMEDIIRPIVQSIRS